jgi:hypothetical protein
MYVRLACAVLAAFGSLSAGANQGGVVPAPGGMTLLPGYQHERGMGIDTLVGKISKPDGLTIRYDIGELGGNYVKNRAKNNAIWAKEQVIAGNKVQMALTNKKRLIVTFPDAYANFYGDVKAEGDIVDMLLMVLTYAPSKKAK